MSNELAAPSTHGVLETLQRSQTLQDGYELWDELRTEHAAFEQKVAEQRQQLQVQGEFLVGTVKAAQAAPSGAAALAPVDTFLNDARAKLDAARAELDQSADESQAQWASVFESVVSDLRGRVERSLQHAKPRLTVMVRPLAGDRRILHLQRPSPDDAVRLLSLFAGAIPTRYGFLFDDSTDDQSKATPTLYADDGVTEVRPAPVAVQALVGQGGVTLPLKAMLPMRVGETFVRFVTRGPVLEAEVLDGEAFRNVLSREEAEAIAGALLRLKLEGRIELELSVSA